MLNSDKSDLKSLTPSEIRVLSELAGAKTAKQIGFSLNISDKTVRNHLQNVRTKLGVRGFHSLLKLAINNKSELYKLKQKKG